MMPSENWIRFEASPSFAVPCDLVDRHLNAPAEELRLLLLLLRNPNATFRTEDLLRTLQTEPKRLADALEYWVKAGLLFHTGTSYSLTRPKLSASDFAAYNPETIAKRLEGDSALQYLYHAAEEALKKPLTSTDASLILSLVDWCGLPAEVVALLIRYGGENGKSLREIAKLGVRWSDDGVRTFEQAEELLRREAEKKNTVSRIAARFGILGSRALTEAEKKVFLKWKEEFSFGLDMIGAAYDETVKNTGKYTYAYVDRILTNWHTAGYTTPDQALSAPKPTEKTRKTPARKSAPNNPKKSSAAGDAMDLAWEIAGGNDE